MSFFYDIEENLSFLKSTPFQGEIEGYMLSSNNCHFEGAQATEKSPIKWRRDTLLQLHPYDGDSSWLRHFGMTNILRGATNRPLNTPPRLRRFLAFGFGMTNESEKLFFCFKGKVGRGMCPLP
ncbi:MAG: hypothetical protein ACPLKS_07540, partial [Caldisericum exile]|uniref:hypothetical protein n=1 Tax=Caldisericum exile TaxID=693075 RepID=UPI003C771446